MSGIRLCINGNWRTAAGSPTTTMLDYLRRDLLLTGTKEGCAEGDCGACTIVVGMPRSDGSIAWRAVNSCLMVVAQADGLPVITVEGLAKPDGQLHSVQKSLVDADATQCGFCTPGFAMSMFAFAHEGGVRNEADIHEALAGNLCRCTGYRPIVEACRTMDADPAGCGAAENVGETESEFRAAGQIYLAPHNLTELLEAKSNYPDATLLGGGTDLGIQISKGRQVFPAVISTQRVKCLRNITETDRFLTLGGSVTYTEALPYLAKCFPSFADLVRRIGSPQIRNLGTLAGNLANASPIGDAIPCLIALDAVITLRSIWATREVAAEDFIRAYRTTALHRDEIIEKISIPRLKAGTNFTAYKLSKRLDQDISTVVGAFRVRVENGIVTEFRAAYGGMAAITMRAKNVEEYLTGKPWIPLSVEQANNSMSKDFAPMTDHRGTGAYRLRAAANLLRRLQLESEIGTPLKVWQL